MKVISIISIVYGGLSTLAGIVYSLIFALLHSVVSRIPFEELYVEESLLNGNVNFRTILESSMDLYYVIIPLMFIVGIFFLIAGTRMLRKEKSSASFTKIAAQINIAGYIIYVISAYTILIPIYREIFTPEIMPLFITMIVISLIIGAILACGYPIFLLIYLNNKRIMKSEYFQNSIRSF